MSSVGYAVRNDGKRFIVMALVGTTYTDIATCEALEIAEQVADAMNQFKAGDRR